MTVVDVHPLVRMDPYRFGKGPDPELQVGTHGWSSRDLENPEIRGLWDRGRYEIIDGVLTLMPAARFRGGAVVVNLQFLMREHFGRRATPCACSAEVDIQIDPLRVLRADGVIVVGEDLRRFESLKFEEPEPDWQDHPLVVPPTIVIESVSRGHEVHDRVTKRKWYAEFGVPHYWIVDGLGRTLDCLLLEAGEYTTEAAGKDDQALVLPSFDGLSISLKEVWGR